MSPDDQITGPLTLAVGLLFAISPAILLAVWWGPRLWRERNEQRAAGVPGVADQAVSVHEGTGQ